MKRFVRQVETGCYAVVFASTRSNASDGYDEMAARMVELASEQPGFIGLETCRDADGFGLTVSYWESETAIRCWKEHAEHRVAQDMGCRAWYDDFQLRVCRVERAYEWRRPQVDQAEGSGDAPE